MVKKDKICLSFKFQVIEIFIRKISFVKEFAFLTIAGKSFGGYVEAMDALINKE